MDRRLWHFNTKRIEMKRYFEPISMTAALAALTAAAGTAGVGAGIAGSFGAFGKKKRDVPDPLYGLRSQLEDLARQVPAFGERHKALLGEEFGRQEREGLQGISENIRAERGFGNTSLQDELNRKLRESLGARKAEALLNVDKWVTGEQANILKGTASMYPGQTELPEEENWQANLLGMGANLAVQNWMQDQQWKRMADMFGNKDKTTTGGVPSGGGAYTDLLENPEWQSKYLKV